MQKVEKKRRKSRPRLRLILLITAVLVLAASLGLHALLRRDAVTPPVSSGQTGGVITDHTADAAVRIQAVLPDGEGWTLLRQGDSYVMEDEPDFPLDAYTVEEIVAAVSPFSYNDVLAETADIYADHLDEYGFDQPLSVVTVDYADGRSLTARIGAINRLETPFYYMLLDGDERLYALNTSSASALYQQRRALRRIVQPPIYRALLDGIHVQRPDGDLHWVLEGSVKETDAIDHWMLVSPFRYAADGERMTALLKNLENLRLGAYVCEATPEALTRYGFDTPRLTLALHMADGTLGTVNAEGVYDVTNQTEHTVTLVAGGQESDLTDYILYDGCIYAASHFTYGVFMNLTAASTVSRYPVLTALGNLRSLFIEHGGETVVYEITRTEQVAENNDLILDENDQIVYDVSVTKNGLPFRRESFELAYQQLLLVTVSGALDNPAFAPSAPHTVYTFHDISGSVHTIALSDYDAMHDAVTVDGLTIYYLIKGALAFTPAE